MSRDFRLKKSCQKAVDFLLKRQSPGLGWKYEPGGERGGGSITAWVMLALHAARKARLKVPESAFNGALKLFDTMTDTDGSVGCRMRGGKGCDIRGRCERYEKLPAITAAATACRLLCGAAKDDAKITKAVKHLMENLPVWNKPKNDKVDMYYWFWGTLAMKLYGGRQWHTWNEAMKNALLCTQRQGGCADGSWDPCGKWGMIGGRVYTTAINTLTLEIFRCYPLEGLLNWARPPKAK